MGTAPKKYHISDDGKVYRINDDGSFTELGNAESLSEHHESSLNNIDSKSKNRKVYKVETDEKQRKSLNSNNGPSTSKSKTTLWTILALAIIICAAIGLITYHEYEDRSEYPADAIDTDTAVIDIYGYDSNLTDSITIVKTDHSRISQDLSFDENKKSIKKKSSTPVKPVTTHNEQIEKSSNSEENLYMSKSIASPQTNELLSVSSSNAEEKPNQSNENNDAKIHVRVKKKCSVTVTHKVYYTKDQEENPSL